MGAEIQSPFSFPSPVPWSARGRYKGNMGASGGPGNSGHEVNPGLELDEQERKKVRGSRMGEKGQHSRM